VSAKSAIANNSALLSCFLLGRHPTGACHWPELIFCNTGLSVFFRMEGTLRDVEIPRFSVGNHLQAGMLTFELESNLPVPRNVAWNGFVWR